MEGRPSCVPLNAIGRYHMGTACREAKDMDVALHGSWIGVKRGSVRLLGWFLPHMAPNRPQQPHAGSTSVLARNWHVSRRIYHRLLLGASTVHSEDSSYV